MNPFTAPGEWLRCQLHCHTDQSDGEPTIAELIAHYEAAGCDVLAITDHWLITRGESSTMLMLPASELSSKLADGKMVFYEDIGKAFLTEDGTLTKEVMPDFLHLSAKGYEIWAKSIEPAVAKILGDKPLE